MRERDLFIEALQKTNPADRIAYLDAACAGDDVLRQRVLQLLAQHEKNESFLLDAPVPLQHVAPNATIDLPTTECPGTVIGPYKLIEQIGEGGMGTVYMAQQAEPIKRLVALKLINPGMDSKQVLARFEAERQALALMDHPNIAKVFDAGTTEAGRPFFVMELVKGALITKYCDEHRLTPKQRLELFVPVCQAIQHAHQKGIIHRDIKPSNVLVAQYDGKPVPKVIDFGVAKAMGQQLSEQTLVTGFGNIVGTLEYMSPEQAEMNQLDIDTRSDIYSLGVLLYELLTGSTPLDKKRLKEAAFMELLRVIREEEPPKPSTRLSDSKDSLPSVSAQRQMEPAKLTRLVRGELDWIVMKALDKDRNRRYETANGFAMDVQRYLADEPVQACPPSAGYRLRKLFRRNKAALVTTAAVLLLVLITSVSIGWSLWDRSARWAGTEHTMTVALARTAQLAEQARKLPTNNSDEASAALAAWRQAEDTLNQAAAALSAGTADDDMRQQVATMRVDVETGRQQAERGLARARRMEKLIRDLDEARMAKLTLKDQRYDLESTTVKFAEAFAAYGLDIETGAIEDLARQIAAEQPDVREAMLISLTEWNQIARIRGITVSQKRLFDLLQAADDDPWRRRYVVAAAANDTKVMRELSAEALKLAWPAPAYAHFASILHLQNMRDEALGLLRRGRELHPADFWMHFTLGALLRLPKGKDIGGMVIMRAGETALPPVDQEERIGALRAALALRPGSSVVHAELGLALQEAGRLDQAMFELNKAIELDPMYSLPHVTKANNFTKRRQHKEAKTELEQAIKLDPKDFTALSNLGNTLWRLKQFAAATEKFEAAIKLNPNMGSAFLGLGNVLFASGKLDEAMAKYQKAHEIDPQSSLPIDAIGSVLREKKQFAAAAAKSKEAIDLDPMNAVHHCNLGIAYYDMKQTNEAIAALRQAIKLDVDFAKPHHALGTIFLHLNQLPAAMEELKEAMRLDDTDALTHSNLSIVLYRLNKLEEATNECKKAIQLDPNLAAAHNVLGNILDDEGKYEEAIGEFTKSIQFDPTDAEPHNGLGVVYIHRKQFDLAIPNIQKAIELNPSDPKFHVNLALVLQMERQWAKAAVELQKVIDLQPKNPNAYCDLSQAYCVSNQLDDAVAACRKAIALQPDHAGAYFNLARALRRQGKFRDAIEALRKSEILGARQPNWSMPTAELLQRFQRYLELSEKEPREPISLASAQKGIRGALTKDDFLDCYFRTFKCFRKSYAIELKAGRFYQIDLTGEFNVLLRIEDSKYASLAYNDDITPPNIKDSRLVFTPEKDELFRVVVTSSKPGETGEFTLRINEVATAGSSQVLKDALKSSDPKTPQGGFSRKHKIDLVPGRPYVLELEGSRYSTALRLLDPSGSEELVRNFDAGDFVDFSRIDFTPREAGTYVLLVTSANPGETGPYTVRIQGYEPAPLPKK